MVVGCCEISVFVGDEECGRQDVDVVEEKKKEEEMRAPQVRRRQCEVRFILCFTHFTRIAMNGEADWLQGPRAVSLTDLSTSFTCAKSEHEITTGRAQMDGYRTTLHDEDTACDFNTVLRVLLPRHASRTDELSSSSIDITTWMRQHLTGVDQEQIAEPEPTLPAAESTGVSRSSVPQSSNRPSLEQHFMYVRVTSTARQQEKEEHLDFLAKIYIAAAGVVLICLALIVREIRARRPRRTYPRAARLKSERLPPSQTTTPSKTLQYSNRTSMALELSDSDLVDLEVPLTPPRSTTMKRRAESPHPHESTSKRVLTEDASTTADAEDSDDEFVDAEEEITTDYNGVDEAKSSAAFNFEDFVNLDRPSDANEQTNLAQPQIDRFSGHELDQYGCGGQGPNDFSDILGPHGYGNGLTEEESEAQGITAEQHLDFANGLVEYDGQQPETEQNELPPRETWNQMSAAEQDELLNKGSRDAEDEPMFDSYAQGGANGGAFFSGTVEDELLRNDPPVEQDEHEAVDEEGEEEDDTQLGTQQDSFDDDNLFSTTFGDHAEVLSDDEQDHPPQQPQDLIDESSHKVTHPSGPQAVDSTQPTQSKANHSSNEIIDLTHINDKAVVNFLNESKWVYEATDNTIHPSSPPPTSQASTTTTTNGVNKTSAPASAQRTTDLFRAQAEKPTIPRDLGKSLRAFQKFHTRVLHLIPRLPNWSSLPARRYWIAVLHMDRKPTSSSLSEKDFLWMKGNRFSTISTIWNSYQTRSMCDPEDFVLVSRGEVLGMEVKAEELDWFGEKLVVLRAMRKVEAREVVATVKGLLGGFGMVPDQKAEGWRWGWGLAFERGFRLLFGFEDILLLDPIAPVAVGGATNLPHTTIGYEKLKGSNLEMCHEIFISALALHSGMECAMQRVIRTLGKVRRTCDPTPRSHNFKMQYFSLLRRPDSMKPSRTPLFNAWSDSWDHISIV
ncbi:uncharacterized protein MYCFIDRAFT_176455 [Pseudocercospora fijiensis CIRAD86]|uniref:Uncharacterized protein n=1 Tax=Pseudocercospora fijiensis (strain CIRAD86) TaxID=383855 RepID=M3AUJ1_PSEFD|nr:uncharacterized protein MYCFIDRAFT_176455 [Pseudocercospora fijiensis CIRAD86]EME81142.1 hypothetical protein MYCFIDRAFT_176455 [Pseudocercospora fijiensis CIRAD86]